MSSLIAAYSVAWIILMGYVMTLGARQNKLRRQLESLAQRVETNDDAQ